MARPKWRMPDVRLAMVAGLLVLGWFGISIRLVHVQAINSEPYVESGVDQRVREEEKPAVRGTIFDRDGVELAITVDAVTVVADPALISDAHEVAALLAPLVGVDMAVLEERLSRDSRFAYVARRLDRSVADEVELQVGEANIGGISFLTEPKRVYPAGALASQVIGFVQADDGTGLEGLEFMLDDRLKGTPGRQVVERDRFGNPIPQGVFVLDPPEHGVDVLLTLDSEIEYIAEQALFEALRHTGAVSGVVVVLDVESGEILAMANAPTFDPNDRRAVGPSYFRNRAVADTYEPGSTLKVVTIAAALEEGLVEASTRFDVPDEITIELEDEPKVYKDVGRRGTESMSVAEIVARSSNVGTILIQGMIGNETHHQYLSSFGLGRPVSDLPGEASGILQPVEQWCETTCGPSTAIGYRVGVTAVQMAAMFATIANDGVWVEPHILKELILPDLTRERYEPVRRPVLSTGTAQTMQRLLLGVVEAELGTGTRAAVDGFLVGGKTGTTEKFLPAEQAYSKTDRIASFIGMAPISDPKVVVVVVLDSPEGEDANGDDYHFGGVAAAPVFAEVMEATLHYLGVTPDA